MAAESAAGRTDSASHPCKAPDQACLLAVVEAAAVAVACQYKELERLADLRQERRIEVVAVAGILAD